MSNESCICGDLPPGGRFEPGTEPPAGCPEHDRSEMNFCMACGHNHPWVPAQEPVGALLQNVPGVSRLGPCWYHDSEGPCLCRGHVPCDHVPHSICSRGGELHRVCACGRTAVKITTDHDYVRD